MTTLYDIIKAFPTFNDFHEKFIMNGGALTKYPSAFYDDFTNNALNFENIFSMGYRHFYDALCNNTSCNVWARSAWRGASNSDKDIILQRIAIDCADIIAGFDTICNAFQIEYKAIENYSMIEEHTATESDKGGQTGNIMSPANYTNFTNDDDLIMAIKDNANQRTRTDYDNSKNTSYTLTRSGNIGVTTSQQMLESEIVLREKFKTVCENFVANIEKRIMTIEVVEL